MLSTWGGDGGDTINQEEFERVGFDKAMEYHKYYCWYHGFGYCDNCALDKVFKEKRGQYGSASTIIEGE